MCSEDQLCFPSECLDDELGEEMGGGGEGTVYKMKITDSAAWGAYVRKHELHIEMNEKGERQENPDIFNEKFIAVKQVIVSHKDHIKLQIRKLGYIDREMECLR